MDEEQMRRMQALSRLQNQERPPEPGLNPVWGLDVLREPKQALVNKVGPDSALGSLINMLVPEDVALPQLGGLAKLGAVGGIMSKVGKEQQIADKVGHIKQEADLLGAIPNIWNKEEVGKSIAEKLNSEPVWKRNLKK